MAGISIKLEGREIPLRFDVQAWMDIEEAFGSIDDAQRRIRRGEKRMQVGVRLAEILAKGGVRKFGGAGVTAKELMEKLAPKEVMDVIVATQNAVTVGFARKHVDDEDEDIDVVLAEIQSKEKEKNAEGCSTQGP